MSLKITLYKDCILTRDYKEAFNMRNASNIDTYLATLTKLDIYSGDDVYFTNSGTISVENTGLTAFTSDIYNYMVFESGASKRYCFIKNITLVNETAIIEYEEDLWSNYSASMRVRFGNLTYCKRWIPLLSPPPKYLPKEYESNLPLKMSYLYKDYYNERCYVVADVSVYKLVSGGGTSFRNTYSCIIGSTLQALNPDGTPTSDPPVNHSTWRIDNDTLRILTNIKINESGMVVYPNIGEDTIPISETDWRYEILSIKLIPEGMVGQMIFADFSPLSTSLHKLFDNYGIGFSAKYFDTALAYYSIKPVFYILSYIGGDAVQGYEGTEGNINLEYDFTEEISYKVKGLINYSRFIPIVPNGKDLKLKFIFTVNSYSSALLLNVNNELIDISQDFTLPLPLSVQSADITQQQAISRTLQDLNAGFSIFNTIKGGASMGLKDIATLNSAGFLSDYISTVANTTMGYVNREPINASKYSSNKGVSITQRAVENAILYNGFALAEIDPQNEDEVNKYIAKYGYKYDNTFAVDSDVFDTDASDQFVQFNQVAIYGSFSNDIADKLKQILLNGIYLFGTSTV